MSKTPEHRVLVQFLGFCLDLFETSDGSLGMTIEKAPAHEDNPSIDLFVSKELRVTGDLPAVLSASEVLNAVDQASLETLLSAACAWLDDRPEAEIEMLIEAKYASRLLSAMCGYFTERGTDTEQDALLRQAGFVALPLQEPAKPEGYDAPEAKELSERLHRVRQWATTGSGPTATLPLGARCQLLDIIDGR